MQLEAILSAALGLSSPWQLTAAVISSNRERLDITISYTPPDEAVRNPLPAAPPPQLDSISQPEGKMTSVWFNDSFLNFETYLHIETPSDKNLPDSSDLQQPWTRSGSRFSRIPEDGLPNGGVPH